MGTNTKWFTNAFGGAPSCTGQAGQLLAVLNACLVDGFNLLTLDSLVVAGNVATGTKTGHGYKQYQIIEVAGASPAGLNGQWRVTAVTANTFTFTTSGISDQTATGTITAKTPGAGWARPFTGTNVAVYKSQSAYRSGNAGVRVTDTGTTTATCLAAEDWTDVSTPVNSLQTFYIPKSATADATARGWTIIADDRTVYIAISYTSGNRDVLSFGDFKSFLSGDGYAFGVRAPTSANVSNLGHQTTHGYAALWSNTLETYGIAARGYSQALGVKAVRLLSMAGAIYDSYPDLTAANNDLASTGGKSFRLSGNNGYSNTGTTVANSTVYSFASPSPIDGGYHFVPVFIAEGESYAAYRLRGQMRGLLHVMEARPFSADAILPGVDGVTDGLVFGIKTQNQVYTYNGSSVGYAETHIAIDLSDWG